MPQLLQDIGYFSGGTPALSVDTTPRFPGLLGQVVEVNVGTPQAPVIARYKYMKAGGAITALTPVGPKAQATEGDNTVYNDCLTSDCIGIATAAASSGQYLWVQVRGPIANVVSNGAIADGAQVGKRAANADVFSISATYANDTKPIGIATAAAAGNVVPLWLNGTDT